MPLPMEPSHTTTTKRSRLSLQPVCQKLPAGTTVYGNVNKDPAHDTELDGMSTQRPLLCQESMDACSLDVAAGLHDFRSLSRLAAGPSCDIAGPALPMPMQMDGPDGGSEAALSDGGLELQCGQKVKLQSSSLRHDFRPPQKACLWPQSASSSGIEHG